MGTVEHRLEHDVLNVVSLRGSMGVRDLAVLLGVSEQTVRRVVRPMVERGQVAKVHGAVVATQRPGEQPFLARMNVARQAKVAIAAEVARLIDDGDSVVLDTGSTTGYIAQALRQRRELTVVTNSAFIATSLATIPGNRVYVAGTELRSHDGASFDRRAFEVVQSMRVRWAVLSASAVDPECGFMVHDRAEAEMSAAMAAIADIRIMAVDCSKWGRRALVAVDRLREGDIVVSDGPPTRDYCSLLEGLHLVDASPGATERAVYARPTEQAGLGQRVGSGEEDHW
jgi:DeoR family glycerol-3-phosphate regulon repressor